MIFVYMPTVWFSVTPDMEVSTKIILEMSQNDTNLLFDLAQLAAIFKFTGKTLSRAYLKTL